MKRLLGGTGVAIGLKILTGIAAAAAAITVAGAATEVANSGSLNPNDWGISAQVHTCQVTVRASGTRGIGQCVSAIAKHHGKGASGHASGARENGSGNGTPNSHANSHATDKGNNGKGHGKPSNVPPTEPATLPDHTS